MGHTMMGLFRISTRVRVSLCLTAEVVVVVGKQITLPAIYSALTLDIIIQN
jgi:hypothetical protein